MPFALSAPVQAAPPSPAFEAGRKLGELGDTPQDVAVLWVDDPHVALAQALALLYPETARKREIHPTAVLGPEIELGENVSVGPYAVVGTGAKVADGVSLGAHSVVGERCVVGENTDLKDHVTLYPNTVVGVRCIIHSGTSIGVDGFGYVFHEGQHQKVPQVGCCVIEDDVEIGSNVCIDRGSVGETRIGAGTKIDNLVHIAHNVRIGRNCVIVAQVGTVALLVLKLPPESQVVPPWVTALPSRVRSESSATSISVMAPASQHRPASVTTSRPAKHGLDIRLVPARRSCGRMLHS